jgi:hypothetical protein
MSARNTQGHATITALPFAGPEARDAAVPHSTTSSAHATCPAFATCRCSTPQRPAP